MKAKKGVRRPPVQPAAMGNRGDAISGGKLVKSDSPRTRRERKSVIEETFGHLPIR